MNELGSRVFFMRDLHLGRVDYILKSSSGAACNFCVWDVQGLKIYIAGTFHVGLGSSVALRGYAFPWRKTIKNTSLYVFIWKPELVFKLASVYIVFICKELCQ